MIYLGVDPGSSSGAIAWLVTNPATRSYAVRGVGCFTLKDLSVDDICSKLKQVLITFDNRSECHALIETVHAMPKQGVSSSFKFGQSYGTLLGIFASLEIPTEHMHPQKWKTLINLPRTDKRHTSGLKEGKRDSTAAKKLEVEYVRKLYPRFQIKNQNNAAAVLLAHACLVSQRSISPRRSLVPKPLNRK